MQGVVFLGDRRLEVRSFPDPGPRHVVIEIKASSAATALAIRA